MTKIKYDCYHGDGGNVLTHIQLSYKTGNITMFEVLWQYFPGKSLLIINMKACPTLTKEIRVMYKTTFKTIKKSNLDLLTSQNKRCNCQSKKDVIIDGGCN